MIINQNISFKIAKSITGQTYIKRKEIIDNYKVVPFDYDFIANNDEDVTDFRNLNIFFGIGRYNFKVFRQSLINSVLPNWSGFTNSEKKDLVNQYVYPDDLTESDLINILGSQEAYEQWEAQYSPFELSDDRERIFTGYTASTQTELDGKIDEISGGVVDNVPVISTGGKLADSGFSIADLTGSTGGGTWGSITGTLSDQTDLQNALNAKLNLSGGTITGSLKINDELYVTGTSATTTELENAVLLGAITTDGRIVKTNTPALNVSEEVTDVTGNTTITEISGIYYVDTSGGNVTIQLPDASPANDVSKLSIIKKTSDSNTVIITTTGGTQNIGDSTTQTIQFEGKGLSVVSDADNNQWLITQDSRFPRGNFEGEILYWDSVNSAWTPSTNDIGWIQTGTTLNFIIGGNSTPPTFQANASDDIIYINTTGLTGLVSGDDLGFYAGGRGAFGNSVTMDRLRNNVPGNVPRALSLIDTTATLRVWRYVNDGSDPAVELVWGTDDAPDSTNNAWWDFFLDGATGGTDTFAIRRRTGGNDTKLLTVALSGTTIEGVAEVTEKINLNTFSNTSIQTGDFWYNGGESLFFRSETETYDLLDVPTALTAVQIRRTTTFTVPATWGDITFGTTDVESDATVLSADTTNTDRIVAGDSGLYEITYDGVVNPGAEYRLRINDSTVINGSTKDISATVAGFASIDPNMDVSNTVLVQLSVGDYITLQAQQGGAGAATMAADATLKVTKLDSARGATGPQGPQGLPGSGVAIVVTDNGVNPSPTGGSYSILNFSSGVTATDAGDGQTVNIVATGITTPATNGKFQAVDSVGGQDINAVTPNPLTWGQVDFQDTDVFSFTASGSNITVLKDGLYELSFNVNGESGNGRSISGVQFRNNTSALAPTLTADYGRNTSNNDTNNALSPYLITLSANDVLDVVGFRLGDATTNTTKTGASFVRVTYLG